MPPAREACTSRRAGRRGEHELVRRTRAWPKKCRRVAHQRMHQRSDRRTETMANLHCAAAHGNAGGSSARTASRWVMLAAWYCPNCSPYPAKDSCLRWIGINFLVAFSCSYRQPRMRTGTTTSRGPRRVRQQQPARQMTSRCARRVALHKQSLPRKSGIKKASQQL